MKNLFKKKKNLTLRGQKDAAILEIQKAAKELKEKYFNLIVPIKVAYEQLIKITIPELAVVPITLLTQAENNKKSYTESVIAGSPIEAYKNNAIKMLKLKLSAENNLKKLEETKTKLEYIIKTNEAEFKNRLLELDITKTELEATFNLPEITLSSTIGNINEIKSNISEILHKLEINKEVDQIINSIGVNKEEIIKTNNDEYEKLFEAL